MATCWTLTSVATAAEFPVSAEAALTVSGAQQAAATERVKNLSFEEGSLDICINGRKVIMRIPDK